ncbi:hypothetical protein [Streptomyces colonosanans]|uniref:Secreted protein n=1 Tax=Streptomyces colonosanans TaxID=1428652 RepID=A0A1S2Q3J8_9ACTN|nr:hypothetical protein [Streptomyces colonosanans]OIK00614.1 hypothetical protein BIV24_02410 [Streptomyces colonosanans]
MFRRTFWFTTGVAAGVWATTKVNRKLRQLTPESLAAQAANKAIETGHRLKDRAADFAFDVRAGMAQREAELGDALGLDAPVDQLPASPPPSASLEPGYPREQGVPRSRRHAAIENRNNPTYVERSAYSYNRNEDH